jgi:hypothetical protein
MSLKQPPEDPALNEKPEFELECLYDDMDNPQEVTVFTPNGNETASEWITVDCDSAIPIPETR